MKTKTMVLSMFLSFFSCALFAQNQKDTVPTPTNKTDSIPKKDTTKTANASAFLNSTHYMIQNSISNDMWALPANEQNVYGNVSKKKKNILS